MGVGNRALLSCRVTTRRLTFLGDRCGCTRGSFVLRSPVPPPFPFPSPVIQMIRNSHPPASRASISRRSLCWRLTSSFQPWCLLEEVLAYSSYSTSMAIFLSRSLVFRRRVRLCVCVSSSSFARWKCSTRSVGEGRGEVSRRFFFPSTKSTQYERSTSVFLAQSSFFKQHLLYYEIVLYKYCTVPHCIPFSFHSSTFLKVALSTWYLIGEFIFNHSTNE